MTFKINKSLFRLLILAVFYFTSSPKLSYAANTFGNAPTGQVIDIPALLLLVLNLIWPVVITIIVIFFIIAGFKFIMAQGNPEEIKTAIGNRKILNLFQKYLTYGYFPYYMEGIETYQSKLQNSLNKILYEDIPSSYELKSSSIQYLKKIIYLVSRDKCRNM